MFKPNSASAQCLNANDHKLVGVDHHQKTGGADQTLRPNAGVADAEADDAGDGDVELVPVAQGAIDQGQLVQLSWVSVIDVWVLPYGSLTKTTATQCPLA